MEHVFRGVRALQSSDETGSRVVRVTVGLRKWLGGVAADDQIADADDEPSGR